MAENKFVELSAIDVNKYTEKKGALTYLSWAWAVDQLMRHDPAANWAYGDPVRWNDTVMVYCTVTAFGKSMTCQLPVMDHRNKAIANPDSFAVNTAMQRCLVKAIALHGLGLYIYAGEDLPEAGKITPTAGAWESLGEEERTFLEGIADEVIASIAAGDVPMACAVIDSHKLDAEEKVALWTRFDSKQRAGMKKQWATPAAYDYDAALDAMRGAINGAQLQSAYTPAYSRARKDGDQVTMDILEKCKDECKVALGLPLKAKQEPPPPPAAGSITGDPEEGNLDDVPGLGGRVVI